MQLDLATHTTLAEVRQFLEALAPSRSEADVGWTWGGSVLETAQASGAGFAADRPASHHGAVAGASDTADRGVQVFSNEDNEEWA